MGRKKKLINDSDIPQYAIEAVVQCLLPDIIAYFESEEGQREFTEWKRKKKMIFGTIWYYIPEDLIPELCLQGSAPKGTRTPV